ncbi:MAG TPA: hypothetical protein VFC78_03295, partial [Tepidisphaeraceae bacterium]|nr:hypothetical protein [Tepidisphaeraceae bacterium]
EPKLSCTHDRAIESRRFALGLLLLLLALLYASVYRDRAYRFVTFDILGALGVAYCGEVNDAGFGG